MSLQQMVSSQCLTLGSRLLYMKSYYVYILASERKRKLQQKFMMCFVLASSQVSVQDSGKTIE
ncbi:hypothetical protein [Wolbachia endosymbiont of Dactylopius coccus]